MRLERKGTLPFVFDQQDVLCGLYKDTAQDRSMEMREKKALKDGLLLWLMSLEGMVHVYSLRERGEKERENNTQIYLWCDYMISLQVRIFLLCRVA